MSVFVSVKAHDVCVGWVGGGKVCVGVDGGICVCACICVRERETEKKREGGIASSNTRKRNIVS